MAPQISDPGFGREHPPGTADGDTGERSAAKLDTPSRKIGPRSLNPEIPKSDFPEFPNCPEIWRIRRLARNRPRLERIAPKTSAPVGQRGPPNFGPGFWPKRPSNFTKNTTLNPARRRTPFGFGSEPGSYGEKRGTDELRAAPLATCRGFPDSPIPGFPDSFLGLIVNLPVDPTSAAS